MSRLHLRAFSALTLLLLAATAIAPNVSVISAAGAQNLNCNGAQRVEQVFANGAKWSLCWENRSREGIVYRDIHYTPPGGVAIKILAEAGLAQIHVPYADDGARFHDVSDYGLGEDAHLNNLGAVDCPNGTRLQLGSKYMVCRQLVQESLAWVAESQSRVSESLRLFSVSHVGAYNYIPEWRFFDDGTLEPSIGATGKLQRVGVDPRYGWPMNQNGAFGISHTHNYYWRLDFDIGTDGTDETVEEINAVLQSANSQRRVSITAITEESARTVSPDQMRFWRIKDGALRNSIGKPVSIDILPIETGHRGAGPFYEAFTHNDIYFTRFRPCERFASHNPADSSQGCGYNEDVADFVDGEVLGSQDLVVWFGLSFYHVPKNEDEPLMHAHWNRFRIQPRDLYVSTEGPMIDPGPAVPTCGQPNYDAEADKALFIWRSCSNENEWHTLVTAAGGGSNFHKGEIHSTTGFAGITGISIESNDSVGALSAQSLGYSLTTLSPWKDEFMFNVNDSSDVCVNASTRPSGAKIFVGANRVESATALFNPTTLEPCTPPTPPDGTQCGRPSIDLNSDRGLFVWKDCNSSSWHLLIAAGASDTVADNYVGSLQASAGIADATPLSIESTDTLSFSADRANFDMRTVRPWNDEVRVDTNAGGSLCLDVTARPAAALIYVGRDRRTSNANRFDPTDLGACN